ncbi:sensor histidine kinase [Rhizobium sp. 'Codium 1']|uniref:sensor histidine kinase n=1 Tax=Rhizobium sp. 'Codium 1' TaxID=2940484 RepID=UPI001E51C2A3|nr:PAS domain-containing protein [Rhizobium sp. 'Codium 1']MCC8934004.1 PAS domain-containing protein [Rhizobium sp. 'Codium 1']
MSTDPQRNATPGFLKNGGAMAELIRNRDWSDGLGPLEEWPAALRSALSICLNSSFPTAIYWGPELRLLYNDSWSHIPGERHPWALGRPGAEVWSDIWEVVGPQFEKVMLTGEGLSTYDQMLPMIRQGVQTESYWNYSFTAIRDELGEVVGVFNQGNETTAAVLARREAQEEIARLGRLFAQAPAAIAILEGSSHTFKLVNPAYEALVQRTDLVGKTVSQALPEVQSQGFINILDAVYSSGEPYQGKAVPVEFLRPDGERQLRHVDFVFQPITDTSGERVGIFVQATDVTEAANAMAALRDSEQRFEAIVNSIDQMIWSTLPDGYHDYFNQRWYEYTGVPAGQTHGVEWEKVFHPDDRPEAWERWKHSLATGEPYHVEYRLLHHTGVYRWVIGRAQCVRDGNGEITRWYGTCTDIHDLKVAEEERQLLLRELNHRVKNLFAITAGMITMTARSSASVAAMAEALQGRLQALAKAHQLIQPAIISGSQRGETVAFRSLIEEILSPHLADRAAQLSLAGPDLHLGPHASTSFALIFHELATNAAKYGPFRDADGRLDVRWHMDGSSFNLEWREMVARSQSQITAPTMEGFGSKLARTSATHQLGGSIDFQWLPGGVSIALTAASDRLNT